MRKNPHMSKSTPIASKRKEVLDNSREKGWDSSPNYRLPEYNSEKDPYCPRAMIRRYNKVKRDTAVQYAKKGQGASEWIEKTIKKKFEELPPPNIPTLREKALAVAAVREESLTEVEILQKIIVRENLLSELRKLLEFQVDLDGIMSEADELIRAIRFQTLEVIEEIAAWKSDSKAPRQFFYRGQNYLLKLLTDTAFLDEYDDLGDRYGFYFTGNPLFYNGVQGNESHNNSILSSNTFNSDDIDGIQIFRLHDAELLLQREAELFQNKDSVQSSGPAARQSSILNVGEANFSVVENPSTTFNNSFVFPTNESSTISIDNQHSFSHQRASPEGTKRRSPDGTLKPVKVVNDLKLKRARISELEEEIAEIQAMYAHVEDQMFTVNESIEVLKKKVGSIERKKQDAIFNGKTALAQKFMIEEGIVVGEIDQKNNEIKDFQRKKYFLDQERSRRKGLIKVLKNEIKAMTLQSSAKKKLMKKAKKEGILSALLSTSVIMDQTESDNKDDSEEESDSEIVSYQVPPSQHQKGEASFSDDDEGDASILENTGSVFGFGESKFETSIDNVKSHVERSMIASSTKRPVINAHQIISDIQIQSSIYAESVVTRSLEMMWFVMVAAEDVRPKKIAIRSYVKEVLAQGLSNICILKEISQEFVVNCLWEGYDKATHSIVANHLQMARQSVSISCVNRSLQIAQSITINNHLEAEKRYIGMKRILIHDISFNLISNIISQQVKVTSIRKSTSCKFIENILTNSIQNILENLEPVMCSYERFHEIVEELTIGCIGAAVYTVEMKVIPTRNVIKNVQNNKNIHGTIGALPVGTGFALAKAKKTAKDIIELEIYNMQTKETITHLYHSNNGEYASINDAIHDVTKSLDGINPLLFEETTLLYQTDMNIDGRSYNMKLIKHETLYLTLLELHDIRMKTNLKIQLTKKQEKEIEYVRDITEYIQQLFQQSVLFIGYSSLKEAMIQKSGNNILIASDILLNEKKKPEIILQIEEILINYQPYNIKVTEDEIGIRIEVWNISIGKVTSTRLTKRQERDFQLTNDRQQFIVNLLNTPGFAFLL